METGNGVIINTGRTLSNNEGYLFKSQIRQYLDVRGRIIFIARGREGVALDGASYNSLVTNIENMLQGKYNDGEFFHGSDASGREFSFKDIIYIDTSKTGLEQFLRGETYTIVKFYGKTVHETPIVELTALPITAIA